MEITQLLEQTNIASELDEDQLAKIGREVVEGYEADKKSRFDWERENKKWMELALQVAKEKTFPWPHASNIKYPLISVASMQFAARAYPSLVPNDGKVVNCRVNQPDPDGQMTIIAQAVAKFMSNQIMEDMELWEEDMDRLLIILPIIGLAFKKTYYCPVKEENVSKLVLPEDLIVNYWAHSLEECERVTEILYKNKRQVKELQLAEIYLDVDLPEPELHKDPHNPNAMSEQDSTTPYMILEQHSFLDLDDDGYAEPYVVTVEHQSQKVLRIAPRFEMEGVKSDASGKIAKIEPIDYYTKFSCIPNPDGSFYDIGFGHLLGPLNESANTIINQLVDAGSLSNLQAGFIAKGLRVKMGESRFSPGEWKQVNATMDDLRKGIFPLPVREPSNVLFQLLGMIIQSGKELASVAEIFVGKMPGQNTPAYTTKETVEQGMKLFTAIYKRIYRALTKEFRKLYKLNRTYGTPEIQQLVNQYPEKAIVPAADPSASSKADKLRQLQELGQLLQLGTINPIEFTKRYLLAQEIDNPEQLMQQQPQQNPDEQKMQMEMAMKQQEQQGQMAVKQAELQLKQQQQIFDQKMKAQEFQMQQYFEQIKQQLELQKMGQEHSMSMQQQADQHTMTMVTQKQQADQQAEITKQQAAAKPVEKKSTKRETK